MISNILSVSVNNQPIEDNDLVMLGKILCR